jgi:WhiB family transcriptional regulator, redox-sensing transcriptional regulator
MTAPTKTGPDGRVKSRSASFGGVPWFHWDPRSACSQLIDPDVMFDVSAGGVERGKKVCRHCPFKTECHEWAVETRQQHGVYGEVAARERKQLFKAPARKATTS